MNCTLPKLETSTNSRFPGEIISTLSNAHKSLKTELSNFVLAGPKNCALVNIVNENSANSKLVPPSPENFAWRKLVSAFFEKCAFEKSVPHFPVNCVLKNSTSLKKCA